MRNTASMVEYLRNSIDGITININDTTHKISETDTLLKATLGLLMFNSNEFIRLHSILSPTDEDITLSRVSRARESSYETKIHSLMKDIHNYEIELGKLRAVKTTLENFKKYLEEEIDDTND